MGGQFAVLVNDEGLIYTWGNNNSSTPDQDPVYQLSAVLGLQDKPVEQNQGSLGCGNGYAFVIGKTSAQNHQVSSGQIEASEHNNNNDLAALNQEDALEHLTQTDQKLKAEARQIHVEDEVTEMRRTL